MRKQHLSPHVMLNQRFINTVLEEESHFPLEHEI